MNRFTPKQIAAVHRAIHERRDIRHFLPDPVAPEVLQRLLPAAHCAPSAGHLQPWRFIRITDPQLRGPLCQLVKQERPRTAEALGEREDEFMKTSL